jgi:hypothetical protein
MWVLQITLRPWGVKKTLCTYTSTYMCYLYLYSSIQNFASDIFPIQYKFPFDNAKLFDIKHVFKKNSETDPNNLSCSKLSRSGICHSNTGILLRQCLIFLPPASQLNISWPSTLKHLHCIPQVVLLITDFNNYDCAKAL